MAPIRRVPRDIFNKSVFLDHPIPQFQLLHLGVNFGVCFVLEVYFDIQSLYLVEKMLENISVRVEIRIIKAQKFSDVIFSCDFLA